MIRPTIIDLNPVEIYPFMIGFDKCTGSCSVLSPNQCVQKETKDINDTKKSEAKAMQKHISCDFKCKFNSATCNSNQNRNNKTCQCGC